MRPGLPEDVRDVPSSELGAVLHDFGLDLTPEEVGSLAERP